MTDNQSLGERLRAELMADLTVSVVSVILAVVALIAFARVGESITGGGYLGMNIAVFIPYAYEQYWPVAYSRGAAVVWTTSAALVTAGLFIGAYQLVLGAISTAYTAEIAFVVTVLLQYAIAALFMRVRQHA